MASAASPDSAVSNPYAAVAFIAPLTLELIK